MIRLDKSSEELLRECLTIHRPDLLYIVDSPDTIAVDPPLGNELRHAAADEFVRIGLRQDYEPNELGLRLENLIDTLGRLFVFVD